MNIRVFLYIAFLAVSGGFLALPASVAQAQEQGFFENIPDLPLMPGLIENQEESVIFDQPDGRIVEAGAQARDLTAAGILSFYSRILPQLGWRGSGPTYTREGESLTLSAEDSPEGASLSLRLAPR